MTTLRAAADADQAMKGGPGILIGGLMGIVLSGCFSVTEHPDDFAGFRSKVELADFAGTFSSEAETKDGWPVYLGALLFPDFAAAGSLTEIVVVQTSPTQLRIDGIRLSPWEAVANPLVSRTLVQGLDFATREDRLRLSHYTKAMDEMGLGFESSTLALGLDREGNLILESTESGAALIGLIVPVAGQERQIVRFKRKSTDKRKPAEAGGAKAQPTP